jgi:hypothetical protein
MTASMGIALFPIDARNVSTLYATLMRRFT